MLVFEYVIVCCTFKCAFPRYICIFLSVVNFYLFLPLLLLVPRLFFLIIGTFDIGGFFFILGFSRLNFFSVWFQVTRHIFQPLFYFYFFFLSCFHSFFLVNMYYIWLYKQCFVYQFRLIYFYFPKLISLLINQWINIMTDKNTFLNNRLYRRRKYWNEEKRLWVNYADWARTDCVCTTELRMYQLRLEN